MNEDNKKEAKYVMVSPEPSEKEDQIDLFELIRTLLNGWKTIVTFTILCPVIATLYSLKAPEIFKAETLLAPVQEENAANNPSLGQLGGFAAMAGVSMPSDSTVQRVLATLRSRDFVKKYISKRNLLPMLFDDLWDEEKKAWKLGPDEVAPTVESGFSVLRDSIEVVEDKTTGLISVSVFWTDPNLAAEWANDLVDQLNEQMRAQAIEDSKNRMVYLEQELAKTSLQDMRRVLYNLLESENQKAMLANVNVDFALEVIDPAVVPSIRQSPNRKSFVIMGMAGGFFLSVFIIFFLQFLKKFKSSELESTSSNV
jgi:uncharacterized protein involved in exopolysaccharide biosynthesis